MIGLFRRFRVLWWTIISSIVLAANPYLDGSDRRDPDLKLFREMMTQRKKVVLYDINHQALATELRKFANQVRGKGPITSPIGVFFRGDDPLLPESL